MRYLVLVLILALSGIDVRPLDAQDSRSMDAHPLKTADTSSPRATLRSFIDACNEILRRFRGEGLSFRSEAERRAVRGRALRCLDLSEVPESVRVHVGQEAVVYLKEVLDRIDLPAEDTWPDAKQVVDEGIARWRVADTEITIAKVKDGPREGEFLFTAETVERAAEFYEVVRELPFRKRDGITPGFYQFYLSEPGWLIPRSWVRSLPRWAHARWLGQAIWQWTLFGITLFLAALLIATIYLFGYRRARSLRSNVLRYVLTLGFPIAATIVPLTANYFISEHIRISGTVQLVTSYSLRLIFLLTLIVMLLGAGSRVAALLIASPWIAPRGLDAQLVRLVCRVASIAAAAVVFLEGGQQFGIPLTTLLASAGVGGLAVALAAQDTLKNVFGSIMITLDKPYQVGERIVTKDYDGLVEEIGLRSTKIRLLTGHQASIPNEEMARSDIENIGRRPHIRHATTIQMPSCTSVAKVNRALEIVREAVKDHEGLKEELPPRVFLRDVNDASIGIILIYWYHPPDYWDYLAVNERINLQIMEQFEADQIPFARPGRTVHIAEPSPTNESDAPK
ncbi:mechanosensitive ion channel family protein [Thalassoroseus pseudoceratinae]|uniref:mechanosensitive ion channel family protein n=1 Tax=Thalassoroseus pseudoceratinae TaxID=2713176 RepID=UPI001421DF48|nr:mechanosensitive ion channel family protein [Thalassoroseus pseudoceratinae]